MRKDYFKVKKCLAFGLGGGKLFNILITIL